MKNLKINDKRIKDICKKGFVLTTMLFSLTTISGCTETPADYPNEFIYINQEFNEFDKFSKTIIKEGRPTTAYKGENLAVAINKETYEVKEYIFREGSLSGEIYDLNTGYLIVDVIILTNPYDDSVRNNKVILDNNYVVEFRNINDYIEGHNLQEYYTLEEIKNLEPIIIESIKKINEFENNNQKTK